MEKSEVSHLVRCIRHGCEASHQVSSDAGGGTHGSMALLKRLLDRCMSKKMRRKTLTCMKTVADAGMMRASIVSRLSKLCLTAGIRPDVSNPAHDRKAFTSVQAILPFHFSV